jgi:tetratricopeptide (TPR) repeat protein
MFARSYHRPFEVIAQAEEAWQAGESERAQRFFEEGISAYRRSEPEAVDFALGRYGAFLLAQGRTDEAERILAQAIEQGTDLPAIWSDYIRVLADHRDINSFKQGVERMSGAVKHRVEPEVLLAHARRAYREGAIVFAQDVARWVIEKSGLEGDTEGRWAAIGDLGRILERAGQLDQALQLWRNGFNEGSCDPETIDRLSMHLEYAKDYATAVAMIREALQRRLPATAEEKLRKRLARCEARIGDRALPKAGKRSDVQAYSVRQASPLIEPIFQIRLKPSVRNLEVVGSVARCLLASGDSSTLVDIDLTSGSELRRIEHLPLLGNAWFTSDGRGIGIRRTAAVGKGSTLLKFLDAEGRVAAESSVPDATSEIALGPDLWYVGCRNGLLYAFGLDGKQRWTWQTPGACSHTDSAYFRPCPYFVTSRESFAAVASMGNIYAVSPKGDTLWHASIPNEHQTRWEFTIPVSGTPTNDKPYKVLGLSAGATRDQVKSAYRRLALATHPDRNPDDTDATAKFREVQDAYERILAGCTGAGAWQTGTGITISMEIQGVGPTASFLAANRAGVVVGSSQGRLYSFNDAGRLREARVVGDGPVRVAIRPDGTFGAAWCSDALLFFHENKIVNAVNAVDWPNALTMFGDEVVLWRRNDVRVMNSQGQLLWSVEFSKGVATVVAQGDTLVCAAGVLVGFRRLKM